MKQKTGATLKRSRGFVAADFAGGVLNNIVFASRTRAKVKEVAQAKANLPSLPERQREVIDFNDLYENLVDILCDAAHYSPNEGLDMNYKQYRLQIQEAYKPLKPFLTAYLEISPDDDEAGLKLTGRSLDAFEVLVAPIDLKEFFLMDDGNMISRLTRTREALNLYGQHLSLLAEQVA